MSDNRYSQITKKLFQRHLLRADETNAYLTQTEFSRKFKMTVDVCVQKMGELFVSEVEIVTESFSPLGKQMIEKIARKHGMKVQCSNESHQLKYLGSDGGGHYSTDYYHYLQYGRVIVTLR